MTKSAKASLVLILFLTSSISSMHHFRLPNLALNDHDRKSSLILLCCAMTAVGLSFLGYKWIKSIEKPVNNTIPLTTITPITTTNPDPIGKKTESSIDTTNNQLWIETDDQITLSIDIKNYLTKSGLRYLLEKYKQNFGHYNNPETPLKIGRSLYELTLLKCASSYLKSHMTLFNFNNAQQAILLEMASTFKIPKLYLTLLNIIIPSDIKIKKITPYCIALDQGTATLFNKMMELAITSAKKGTFICWSAFNKQYTLDRRYKLCTARRHKPSYDWNGYAIWDNKNSNYIKDKNVPSSTDYNYHIFPRKNLILITNRCGETEESKTTPFIYDITNNKKYYFGINNTKTGETAISPDENYIAICSGFFRCPEKNNLIYIFNISDLNNIEQYKPLNHPKVNGIAFSPDSKLLVSTGDNINLWNISDLEKTSLTNLLPSMFCSRNSMKPKTLLHNTDCENSLIHFNKDNEHIFTRHSKDHVPIILNINCPEKYKAINTGKCCNFRVFPNNSDLIAYEERHDDVPNKNKNLKIINKEGTELFSEEYGRFSSITIVISDNFQHIAISTESSLRSNEDLGYSQPNFKHWLRHIVTLNKTCISIKAANIAGKCKAINNDGSFWIRNSKIEHRRRWTSASEKINLYDANLTCLTTLNYSNPDSNNSHTQPIIFYDDIKKIKPLLENITPLQYNLIKKACNSPRRENSLLSIKNNSFDYLTLKSFGINEKCISDTLKLQITS